MMRKSPDLSVYLARQLGGHEPFLTHLMLFCWSMLSRRKGCGCWCGRHPFNIDCINSRLMPQLCPLNIEKKLEEENGL